jgi:hypothetical protein
VLLGGAERRIVTNNGSYLMERKRSWSISGSGYSRNLSRLKVQRLP